MSTINTKKRTIDDIADQAFIVKVMELNPIEGRSDIELACIKGWKCIVKTGALVVGDLAVYIAMGYKVKGMKPTTMYAMGGIISQGALLSMQCLVDKGFSDLSKFEENDSVATELSVTKHIPHGERGQYKKSNHLPFPDYVPKTESIRLQNDPDLFFAAIQDKDIVITRKEDGCSSTYIYNNGKFVMCGRNYIWKASDIKEQPDYFLMEDKYDLKRGMTKLKRNIAIQAEIIGTKINGNRFQLKEKLLRVFDVFDIDQQQYLGFDEMCAVCTTLGLTTVPLLYRGPGTGAVSSLTMDAFMTMAEAQEYGPGLPAEGIVVRSDDPRWRQRRVIFKVISNVYAELYNVY
eukprot:gene17752-20225_t